MYLKIKNSIFALTLFFLLAGRPAVAERPTAPNLLPYNTAVYLRINDFPSLGDDFQRTSLGRIRNDVSVAPCLLYTSDAADE